MIGRLLKAVGLGLCWLGLLVGMRPAGRVLVRHLGSYHEDTRTVAGMLLAKAGRRALPVLSEAADRREHLDVVLPMLAELGAEQYEPLMRETADRPEPLLAKTGRDSLQILHYHRQRSA